MTTEQAHEFYLNVTGFQQECYRIAAHHGFHDSDDDSVMRALGRLMLITTEVAEAAEAIRYPRGSGNLVEELADIIIRVADFAEEHNLYLGVAIEAKMQKNRERPHMHGGKLA